MAQVERTLGSSEILGGISGRDPLAAGRSERRTCLRMICALPARASRARAQCLGGLAVVALPIR
jgi:hypothetical protein